MFAGIPNLRARSNVHEPAKFGLSTRTAEVRTSGAHAQLGCLYKANALIETTSVIAIVISVFLAIGRISFFKRHKTQTASATCVARCSVLTSQSNGPVMNVVTSA